MPPERGQFLTIDLEVRGPRRLTSLGKTLQAAGGMFGTDIKSGEGSYLIIVNFNFVAPDRAARSPDTQIRLAASAIASLPPKERALWDGADERVFDIGIQGGYEQRRAIAVNLSRASVERIVAVNGTITITVYPAGRRALTPAAAEMQRTMQEKLNRFMRTKASRRR